MLILLLILLKTDKYKIADFNLINVTLNDTLFVRSEFKGGSKSEDTYDLNLYHTIDEEKQSIVGFKKSEVKFKDYFGSLMKMKPTIIKSFLINI